MNVRVRQSVSPTLRHGGIGVLPTDTIYGIVGSVLNKESVLRIYKVRRRNPKKPMIVLVGSMSDLARFGIVLSPKIKKVLKKIWPGAVSVVLDIAAPSAKKKFSYLHRGTGTLAFRMPKLASLRALLQETGPLVAPSANFEGRPSAKTVQEAKKYFGDTVDFYVDTGRRSAKPSTLIKIERDGIVVLRQGSAKV